MIDKLGNTINLTNIAENFSSSPDVKRELLTALTYTSQIYPIFVLSKLEKNMTLNKESTRVLTILNNAAKYLDVTIVCYNKEANFFRNTFKNCKLLEHHYNDPLYSTSANIMPIIRNHIIENFRKTDYLNNPGWFYVFDDDVILRKVSNNSDGITFEDVEDPLDVISTLSILQYNGTKKAYSSITDNNPIGIVTMPCVNPFDICDSDIYPPSVIHPTSKLTIDIDITRACQCVLLNYDAIKEKNIKYETKCILWDDLDFNIQCAYNRLHTVAINGACIHYKTIRPMASSESACYDLYKNKFNKLSAGLYLKWGDEIIPHFRYLNNKSLLNIKVGDYSDWILKGCPIKHTECIVNSLKDLCDGNITLEIFSQLNDVRTL